jgi:ABC-type sulfate transport system permease component
MAARTLVAAGLLVSIFDFVDLPFVAVAVLSLTRDFFSIAIVVSSSSYLTALRSTLVQAGGQTRRPHEKTLTPLKT